MESHIPHMWESEEGIIRTEFNCHDCGTTIVAQLDFSIEGNHVVICPKCGHNHFRVIQKGKITSDRWDSQLKNNRVCERVWTDTVLKMTTSTVCAFLRDKWLNKGRKGQI